MTDYLNEIRDRAQAHEAGIANRAAKENTRGINEAMSAAGQSLNSGGTAGATFELENGDRVTGVVTAIDGGWMFHVATADGERLVYADAVKSAGVCQI